MSNVMSMSTPFFRHSSTKFQQNSDMSMMSVDNGGNFAIVYQTKQKPGECNTAPSYRYTISVCEAWTVSPMKVPWSWYGILKNVELTKKGEKDKVWVSLSLPPVNSRNSTIYGFIGLIHKSLGLGTQVYEVRHHREIGHQTLSFASIDECRKNVGKISMSCRCWSTSSDIIRQNSNIIPT